MFFGNDVTQDSQLPFLPLLKCFIAFSDSPGIRKEQANEYPDNAKNGNDYSNDKPCKCNDCNQPCLHRAALISIVSRSEEHTSELQSQSNLVCRLLLEKKKKASY